MQLQIHTHPFSLTDSLREYIELRLKSALGWSQQEIHRVHLRLLDINGPKGGADMRCQIALSLQGRKNLIIEDTQSNLYAAIDNAFARASNSLARQLARKREIHHNRFYP